MLPESGTQLLAPTINRGALQQNQGWVAQLRRATHLIEVPVRSNWTTAMGFWATDRLRGAPHAAGDSSPDLPISTGQLR